MPQKSSIMQNIVNLSGKNGKREHRSQADYLHTQTYNKTIALFNIK